MHCKHVRSILGWGGVGWGNVVIIRGDYPLQFFLMSPFQVLVVCQIKSDYLYLFYNKTINDKKHLLPLHCFVLKTGAQVLLANLDHDYPYSNSLLLHLG